MERKTTQVQEQQTWTTRPMLAIPYIPPLSGAYREESPLKQRQRTRTCLQGWMRRCPRRRLAFLSVGQTQCPLHSQETPELRGHLPKQMRGVSAIERRFRSY